MPLPPKAAAQTLSVLLYFERFFFVVIVLFMVTSSFWAQSPALAGARIKPSMKATKAGRCAATSAAGPWSCG